MEKIIYNIRPTLQALRKGYAAENLIIKTPKTPLKVKQNSSSRVRLGLTWNDIYNEHLLVQSAVDEVFFKRRKIYLFREPYLVPCFKQYYAKKVESPDNWYLEELILGLLFLNPNPDHLMKKKITERILQTFTECRKVESKVKVGKFAYEPILTFEEVFEEVEFLANCKTALKYYEPQHSETIMYGRMHLDKGDKIALRHAFKKEKAQAYYKPIITKAINKLIVNHPTVKISFKELEKLKIVKKFNHNEYATAKLIRNNLSEEHKEIIKKHDRQALFNKVATKLKYEIFDLMETSTLDEIVKHCKISRSDAMKFREMKQVLQV